ncbi:hypothetical protein V8C43DRAFT_291051 [Trichoderma afarasin]
MECFPSESLFASCYSYMNALSALSFLPFIATLFMSRSECVVHFTFLISSIPTPVKTTSPYSLLSCCPSPSLLVVRQMFVVCCAVHIFILLEDYLLFCFEKASLLLL